jgi:hypothetical protein
LWRAQKEVEVIGHQNKAESFPAVAADRHSQSIDKTLVIGLVLEDTLPRIATAHDMVNGARELDPQRPAHPSNLTPSERCENRKPGLTPSMTPSTNEGI